MVAHRVTPLLFIRFLHRELHTYIHMDLHVYNWLVRVTMYDVWMYVIMSTERDEVSLFEWVFLLPLFHTSQGHTENTSWALGLPTSRLNVRY